MKIKTVVLCHLERANSESKDLLKELTDNKRNKIGFVQCFGNQKRSFVEKIPPFRYASVGMTKCRRMS